MDTLTTAKILQEAGFDSKKAEVIAMLFAHNDDVATKSFVETKIANLETKIAHVESAIKQFVEAKIINVETKIDHVESATKQFVETKISQLSNRMFITTISLTAIIIAAIRFL